MVLSHDTLIIVIVCVSVGALVLALVLARFIYRVCISTQKSAPLPPIQPLAHHREQQIAKVHNRRTSSYLNAPSPFAIATDLRSSNSSGSLLRKESPVSSSPSRSLLVSDTGEDISLAHEVLPADLLPLPNPSLQAPNSDSDVSLASPESISYPPGMTSPSSVQSHSSTNSRRARSSSSHSTRHPQRRAVSVSSSAGGTHRTSRRGLPHDPHNPIQVILPTPLAPMAYGQPALPFNSARHSVVDMWAPRAVRSTSSLRHEELPSNHAPHSQPPSPVRIPRRMSSMPPLPSPLSSSSTPPFESQASHSYVPPVPVLPLPSPYNTMPVGMNANPHHADPILQDRNQEYVSRGRSKAVDDRKY